MHPEIEKLIEFALADGQVTAKEREIILRKANSLGLDQDEVEMVLEGRIHQLQTKPPLQNQKSGDLKKCPSCGAPVKSFNSNCSDCGHEFRSIEAVSSIKSLHNELQKGEEDERRKERSWAEKIDGELAVAKSVANRQKSIISSFPVPNTKEDLLEFLSVASGEASKKLSFFISSAHPDAIIKKAWLSKCEQLIHKSKLTFRDDKKMLEEIEGYAKQLKIK